MVSPRTVRRRVLVDGRVQGVFYRDTCRTLARQTGVSGWARNRPDGAVEVVLEGEPAAVDRMIAWCRSGPPHALVTSVKVTDEEPEGLSGFSVR
ncbi:MAG TPA: acylphosphatase [Acidimicrobiales bacterium]|nr:acylphosphatase [Acidimicrobiales bacterium]